MIEVRYAQFIHRPEQELDEVVAENAYVHLERMQDHTFMLIVRAGHAEVSVLIGPKRAYCLADVLMAAGDVVETRPGQLPRRPATQQPEPRP